MKRVARNWALFLVLIPVTVFGDSESKTATEIFDSLVKPGDRGMNVLQVKQYLRQYSKPYNDPKYTAREKIDPAFRDFMDQLISEQANDLVCNYGVGPRCSSPSEPNTSPIAPPNRVITRPAFVKNVAAKNPDVGKEKTTNYLATLTNKVLSDDKLTISKSTTVAGDDKKPAQFSWTKSPKSSAFTIDGALGYTLDSLPNADLGRLGTLSTLITPTAEAHTSSDPKQQQDSISAKLVVEFDLVPKDDTAWLKGQTLLVSPNYETDSKKAIETAGANIMYTPTFDSWFHDGQLISLLPKSEYPAFSWRPYVGFEVGDVIEDQKNMVAYRSQDTFCRFVSQLHGDLYLTPKFDVAVDFYHRTFLTGDQKSFDYVELSPTLFLDGSAENPASQHFSIGLTLKSGKTTPQFKEVNSLSVWLGIKFQGPSK